MTSRFFESFLAAGLADEEPEPVGIKKNLLCGIKDLIIIREDLESLKQKLGGQQIGESQLKWMRFMTLSEERKVWVGIRYSHPYRSDSCEGVYDIELIRTQKGGEPQSIDPTKGRVPIRTIRAEDVNTYEDLFE